MLKKMGDTEVFHVVRKEACFDRACDEAWRRAVSIARIDEDGHSTIEGWDRSSSYIEMEFVGYMKQGASDNLYTFKVTAKESEDA